MRLDKEGCESLRREIKGIADDIKDAEWPRESEAVANVTLAYRHLEDASMRLGKVLQAIDASMRLGKVLQAIDGGVSSDYA
jgi:hypothetical protein